VLAETTRGAALTSARLSRRAPSAPEYAERLAALRTASDELARVVGAGATSLSSEDFSRACARREVAQRELAALARELPGGAGRSVELDAQSLAIRLAAGEVAVAFRRFPRIRLETADGGPPSTKETSVASLCAFVLRRSKAGEEKGSEELSELTLVDLGPLAPIEEAVRAWRESLGVSHDGRGIGVGVRTGSVSSEREEGGRLRAQVLDPLLPALAGARRIVVVPDDVMHLVPFDALPLDQDSLVGDRREVETRTTLTELLRGFEPSRHPSGLVAFGDVDYGAAADPVPRSGADSGILRGSAFERGFSALPGTGVEVRGIADTFRLRFGSEAPLELVENVAATRERLLSRAPGARFLHVATHGWFAPESIRSWSDPEPIDVHSGLGARLTGEELVRGMSPMLLCGLALAGASRPESAAGRLPGLVTAEELSALDLSGCELVVLSACDTNVGVRRAGQGVASLQKALQMAGARSVITSLWKVPDEATRDLMLEFYRRLWVEKQPQGRALWEAKQGLREATDERGRPIYSTRDWAAWVLTGEPE
jgi:CHAT domain-containing protein